MTILNQCIEFVFFYRKSTLRMKLIWINLINIYECIERFIERSFLDEIIASHRVLIEKFKHLCRPTEYINGSSSFKCYVRYYHEKEMITICEMTCLFFICLFLCIILCLRLRLHFDFHWIFLWNLLNKDGSVLTNEIIPFVGSVLRSFDLFSSWTNINWPNEILSIASEDDVIAATFYFE